MIERADLHDPRDYVRKEALEARQAARRLGAPVVQRGVAGEWRVAMPYRPTLQQAREYRRARLAAVERAGLSPQDRLRLADRETRLLRLAPASAQ